MTRELSSGRGARKGGRFRNCTGKRRRAPGPCYSQRAVHPDPAQSPAMSALARAPLALHCRSGRARVVRSRAFRAPRPAPRNAAPAVRQLATRAPEPLARRVGLRIVISTAESRPGSTRHALTPLAAADARRAGVLRGCTARHVAPRGGAAGRRCAGGCAAWRGACQRPPRCRGGQGGAPGRAARRRRGELAHRCWQPGAHPSAARSPRVRRADKVAALRAQVFEEPEFSVGDDKSPNTHSRQDEGLRQQTNI